MNYLSIIAGLVVAHSLCHRIARKNLILFQLQLMALRPRKNQRLEPEMSSIVEILKRMVGFQLATMRRRKQVDKRIKALRELIPGCDKVDQASILEDAIKYIQALQQLHQITAMRMGLMSQEAYMSQAGMRQMPQMEPTNGIMANQTVIPPFALPTSDSLSGLQMVPQFQAPFCPQFLQSTPYTMPLLPSFFTTPSPTMTQGRTIRDSSASNPRFELLREYEEAIDYNNSSQGVQGESSNSASDSTTEKS